MNRHWKICRLCLIEQQNSWERQIVNVFEHNLSNLASQIERCTSVQILNNSGLPETACTQCIQTISQFDHFREMCLYSDSIIRSRNSQIQEKHTERQNNIEKVLSNGVSNDLEIPDAIKVGTPQILTNDFRSTLSEQSIFKKTSQQPENQDFINIMEQHEEKEEGDLYDISENDNTTDSDSICKERRKLYINSDTDSMSPQSPRNRKKKVKRKTKNNCISKLQHSLVYTEEDYAILGRERKVRIYKMDECMRQIIGENTYPCDICSDVFLTFFDYFEHQEKHNGKDVFKCHKCSEVFMYRKLLVKHDARHKIACEICYLEVLPKSMAAHLLIHTDVHKCHECGTRHTSNASLDKHIKARHSGIKGYVCHICGKQSSCQSSMNRHMAYHQDERPYKCNHCDFSAKSLNIVQVHTKRLHFAEKSVCEICAKLFKSRQSLIQHMKRIHTTRKHICGVCNKAFIERYNLTQHLKKHSGQRLHECKICHKEFFTVRKLKEHMHSHREGCVNCPKCGKEFFYKKYFLNHVFKCTKTDN